MSLDSWDLAVLDMAGTTFVDDGMIVGAVTEAMAAVAPGQDVDLAEVGRLRGASKRDLFGALAPTNADEALDAFNAALQRLAASGAMAAVEGAAAAVRALQEGGVPVCLTTGLDRAVVDVVLDQQGWVDTADWVFTAAEVGRGRPHPDLVLAAALRAQVRAMDRVVVCGDTVNDLNCGMNARAGLLVGVLSGAHDRSTLESVPGSTIVDSVADLPALLASATPG